MYIKFEDKNSNGRGFYEKFINQIKIIENFDDSFNNNYYCLLSSFYYLLDIELRLSQFAVIIQIFYLIAFLRVFIGNLMNYW